MSQVAGRVHTDQKDIDRIEALAARLPDEARVELVLYDGDRIEGTVSVRPTVQIFRDENGNEGLNALVRIDDAADPAHAHYVWLDRIREIRRRDEA